MKAQILAFGATEKEFKLRLQKAFLPLRIRLKWAGPEDHNRKIEEIIELPSLPETSAFSKEKPSGEPKEITEPMLLFCGLSSGTLDHVLQAMRKNGIRIPYKAILTPHNQGWTPEELFSELIEEHKQMNQSK